MDEQVGWCPFCESPVLDSQPRRRNTDRICDQPWVHVACVEADEDEARDVEAGRRDQAAYFHERDYSWTGGIR